MSELISRTFQAERGLALARDTIGAYQKAFGDICNALGCNADDALALAAIAELQKRIGELEAERDGFREYAHAITKALTGLVGGGSEMFAGRIATGTGREMFKADLPFCIDRIRRRFDATHEAIKGESRERKRREDCEAALREEGFRFACGDAAKDYFSCHPSSSGNEPGNGRSE